MFIGGEKSENIFDKSVENSSDGRKNFNNHYHLVERNTSALNIMSGVKSLVCDLNGIIIAEMVYRCMICDVVYETIPEVQIHYQTKHIDQDLSTNGNNSSNNNSKTSKTKSSKSTNISFLNSFQLPSDPISDNTSEPSTPQTLTFDVPSGLKTLHQQFECTSKESPQKKKSNKSLSNNDSKTKMALNQKSRVLGQMTSPTIKSGFITCEICGTTKFYKYTQRRFGVFSCVGCAKFYSKYLLKPVAYKMCENLGKCNLKVSECEPNGRCKACLIHKCKSKFIIDPKKLNNYRINDSNENKSKTNSKQISTKDSNNKNNKHSKTSNTVSTESKSKSNSTAAKTESDTHQKVTTYHTSNKKTKPERTHTKNINDKNGIQSKRSSNSSGLSKGTTGKTTVQMKTKKTQLKATEMESKRRRNQSVCRKCLGSKVKDCNHSGNGLEPNKFKNRDRTRLSLKRNQCLTRSRNK